MSLASDIVSIATCAKVKITCAESCTGGMVSVALTNTAGSSAIFEQGFITYSNTAKTKTLGVSSRTIKTTGAVSEPVAKEMASGALLTSGADIAVSVSGVAGPGGSEFKPEGRVCFGLATSHKVFSETVEFGAIGRAKVRKAATNHALKLIFDYLKRVH